jgi:hypothetical protein
MIGLDDLKQSLKAKADGCADAGTLVSMADARWFVLGLCDEAKVERPSPDSLEYYASELVRLTLEAHENRTSRLRLRRTG